LADGYDENWEYSPELYVPVHDGILCPATGGAVGGPFLYWCVDCTKGGFCQAVSTPELPGLVDLPDVGICCR
jgi:hypothetical protein